MLSAFSFFIDKPIVIATKGLGLGIIVIEIEGLRINEGIVFHAFVECGLPSFAVGEVAAPAFLAFVGFFFIYFCGVTGEGALGCDEAEGSGNGKLVGVIHVEAFVKAVGGFSGGFDLEDDVPDFLVAFHGGEQSIAPLGIRMNLEHGFGGVDHPTGIVVALWAWQGGEPGIILVLHFMGWRACEPVFGVGFEIFGIAHPAEIIELVTGGSRDGATVRGPAWEAGKFGEDVEFFAVFFPFLEVLADHPPAVVEDLGIVFVRAEEFGDIVLKEFFVVVFFEPTVEFRSVAVEVGVAVEFFNVSSECFLSDFLDAL